MTALAIHGRIRTTTMTTTTTSSWLWTIIYCLVILQAVEFGVAQSIEENGSEKQHQGDVPTLLESVQCLLETDRTISIQYSTFLESYVEVNPSDAYYPLTTTAQQHEQHFVDDDYTKEYPILQVKVCWCSQYFNRRYEYCPTQFDACRVDGFDGPITCFRDYHGGAFVRGFWFICVFWFFTLIYAFSCTEQGYAARSFLKRKLCLKCSCNTTTTTTTTNAATTEGGGNHHHQQRHYSTEESYLLHEIETMIEEDPDRATWLLRSAFLRERNRQQLEETRMARRRRNGGSNTRSRERGNTNDTEQQQQSSEGTNNDDTNVTAPPRTTTNNNNNNNSLSEWHQIVEIRVKKYTRPSKTMDATESTFCEDDQQQQIGNSADHPVASFSSSSWSPPPPAESSSTFSFTASASQILSDALSTVSLNGLTVDNNNNNNGDAADNFAESGGEGGGGGAETINPN